MASDPFLDEVVEEALAPYRAALSEDLLEAMRRVLEDTLATEPLARQLLSRARPRAVPLQSGDQPTDAQGQEPGDVAAAGGRATGTGGGAAGGES